MNTDKQEKVELKKAAVGEQNEQNLIMESGMSNERLIQVIMLVHYLIMAALERY